MKAPTKIGKPGVNYYSLLGVPSTATQEEITRAFRQKILHVHLDKMGPEDDKEVCYLTIEAHRILSDKALRQKYDVERSSSKSYKDSGEKFIPAGYICYDVGDQQMSKQLMDSILGWSKEYDHVAQDLSDNYFDCFSEMVEKIMKDSDKSESNDLLNRKQQKSEYFRCDTCDKNFLSEAHHWDTVIKPYRAMFYSDKQGIGALISYFESLIGPKLYNWELRYLPSRLLGIWGDSEWSTLSLIKKEANRILKQCKYKPDTSRSSSSASNSSPSSSASSSPEPSTTAEVILKLEVHLEKCATNRSNASFISAQNVFLRRSLLQNLIWVLETKGDTLEPMISRMNELVMQDDLQEILCLGMAMREILAFQNSEWGQLIQDALSNEYFELAMMWTMLAVQSGDKGKSDWFQLGMTIRGMGDAVLAHFCFLLAGCDSVTAWEELADIFTQNGLHYAACEYHLNKGNLFHLLHKSKAFKNIDPEASSIYGGIYYASRVKGILQILKNRSTQCSSGSNEQYNAEIEEITEIIQDLGGNPLEGFRIIISTWPDVFEESPGYWIHRATIQFLRKGKVNLKAQKLILAACHFLPEEEKQEEIGIVADDESNLARQMLENALDNNDFEMLTDVLLHLNNRTLDTAQEYLEIIKPKPPVPPPANDEGKENENEDDDTSETKSETEDGAKEEETKEQEPKLREAPPAPSHKSAMIFLLSGTIFKVKECWLEAMKDYQTALLSAPEVLHRVLPCVSKLVQDIQFHEAVVSQVHQEINELQRSLQNEEYPNIDQFSSDKRQSLILTDVAPKMDYGYKDAVSRIKADPDNLQPPPPPPDEEQEAPPPPPANTPMVTLDKNEEAIQSGQQDGQIDQLSAALAYVDLLKALPLQMHPGPIVMAASHFLRAMDDAKPEDIGMLYALRKAIMLMAENLLRVDKKLQHTIQHGLTHKQMLSILLSAHEKLSKAMQAARKNEDDEEEEEEDNEKDAKDKKDLIRQSDAHLISKFLRNVVNFPKVEPLANIPTLNCSDLVYVETLGNHFLSHFCADKVRQKHQSPMIPKHLHAYTHFVEVWKGRSTLSDFPQARVKVMQELVECNEKWRMGSIERMMKCPFLLFNDDGFSPPVQCLLQLRNPVKSYRSIDGFTIDYEKGKVELLFSRDRITPADTLFDHDDIRDVVSLCRTGLDRIVFSLETPDSGMLTSHPFKEARISSSSAQSRSYFNSQQQQKIWSQIPEYIQSTLSRVSMLLCYLTSGWEISAESPFWMRRTDEGLLSRLDEHLQHLARPIGWRKAERRGNNEKSPLGIDSETIGKFWLNMVEVFEEIEEEEDDDCYDSNNPISMIHSRQLTYRVGQIRTEMRPHTLVMTIDPKQKRQRLSPEAEFCRDFTKNFQEFSRAFPELARLEELVKISVVCSKLKQVLKENKATIQEFNLQSKSRDAHVHKMKAVARVCKSIENFLGIQRTSGETSEDDCNWFPATFCHNMDPDVYDVTAGIELDPVVTYGPVSTHPKPIRVPLENIIPQEEEEENEVDTQTVIKQEQNAELEESEEEEDEGEEEEEEEYSESESIEMEEERINEVTDNEQSQANANLSAVPEESEEMEESEEIMDENEEDDIMEEEDEELMAANDVAEGEEEKEFEECEDDVGYCEHAENEEELEMANNEDESKSEDGDEEESNDEAENKGADEESIAEEAEYGDLEEEEEVTDNDYEQLQQSESEEDGENDALDGKEELEIQQEKDNELTISANPNEESDHVSTTCNPWDDENEPNESSGEDESKEEMVSEDEDEEEQLENSEEVLEYESDSNEKCIEVIESNSDEDDSPTFTIKILKQPKPIVSNKEDEPRHDCKKEVEYSSKSNNVTPVESSKRSFLSRRSKEDLLVKICSENKEMKEPTL